MNRLETIASRQRNGRIRDLMFAAFVALVAAVGVTTLGSTIGEALQIAAR